MTGQVEQELPKPIIDYLKVEDDGSPYLQGSRCLECAETYVGARQWCANCAAQDKMVPIRLPNRGVLHSYTIVRRSYPGIETPFIPVVVDMEGGGSLLGCLVDVEPDPKAVVFGMPVKVIYQEVPRRDRDNNRYFSFFFSPLED